MAAIKNRNGCACCSGSGPPQPICAYVYGCNQYLGGPGPYPALPGATVTVTPATGAVVSGQTDATGHVCVSPPAGSTGPYSVAISAPGYATQTVSAGAGTTITVDLTKTQVTVAIHVSGCGDVPGATVTAPDGQTCTTDSGGNCTFLIGYTPGTTAGFTATAPRYSQGAQSIGPFAAGSVPCSTQATIALAAAPGYACCADACAPTPYATTLHVTIDGQTFALPLTGPGPLCVWQACVTFTGATTFLGSDSANRCTGTGATQAMAIGVVVSVRITAPGQAALILTYNSCNAGLAAGSTAFGDVAHGCAPLDGYCEFSNAPNPPIYDEAPVSCATAGDANPAVQCGGGFIYRQAYGSADTSGAGAANGGYQRANVAFTCPPLVISGTFPAQQFPGSATQYPPFFLNYSLSE